MKQKQPTHKKKWILLAAAVLAIGGLIYAGLKKNGGPHYEWAEAKRMTVTQEVSATGRVKPAQSAELAFEVGGKITTVSAKVGDQVKAGALLVALNDSSLRADLRQAQAGVQAAQAQLSQSQAAVEGQQAKLAELRAGTRPEEIQLARTAVQNAEKELQDATLSLESATSKAEADLQSTLSSAAAALIKAATAGKTALVNLTDVQYAHFNTLNQDGVRIANAKAKAVETLLGTRDAGRWSGDNLALLTGGAYQDAIMAQADPSAEKVDRALQSVLDGLQKTIATLDTIPIIPALTSTEKTLLDTEKLNVNNESITISAKKQAIDGQRANNQNAITSAQNQENAAKNLLATAQDQLALKLAGTTEEEIKTQEAQVRQAQAGLQSQKAMVSQAWARVQSLQALIDQMKLTAPITGTVTTMEARVGEIAPPHVIMATVIEESDFQIESDIAEVDIAKIKIGDPAEVTLDAYGSTIPFNATATKIDPAETIIEGVPSYKVTFSFDQQDERIKSGMTANLEILTARKEDVVAVPQRAVLSKDGERSVRVLRMEPDPKNPKNTIETMTEVPVIVGIRGVDGFVEILDGIQEGDRVVTAVREQ